MNDIHGLSLSMIKDFARSKEWRAIVADIDVRIATLSRKLWQKGLPSDETEFRRGQLDELTYIKQLLDTWQEELQHGRRPEYQPE